MASKPRTKTPNITKFSPLRQRDKETKGQIDNETKGQRDKETKGQRDSVRWVSQLKKRKSS